MLKKCYLIVLKASHLWGKKKEEKEKHGKEKRGKKEFGNPGLSIL